MKKHFIDQLKKFDIFFSEKLKSTEDNSVDEFFVNIAQEFISKINIQVDFEKCKNLDFEQSFIEVGDEGETRIFFKYKKELATYFNGIEIFIDHEVSIDFFGETHQHFAVVGNHTTGENKWEYSEIDDAVKILTSTFHFPVKILLVTWKQYTLSSGVWNYKHHRYEVVRFIPILYFLKRFFQPWIKKKTKLICVDWEYDIENQKVLTKDEVLKKLEQFILNEISYSELCDWAGEINQKSKDRVLRYEDCEIEDCIVALILSESDMPSRYINREICSELGIKVLIVLEEWKYNLTQTEMKNMIAMLKK